MSEIQIPKTAMPCKVWTNMLLMQDADLTRYRKQHTIDLPLKDHFWFEVDHWFETDAFVTGNGCAYINSPEGFGPPHIIRLSRGAFFEEKRDLVKRLLVAAVDPCRNLVRYADEIRTSDYDKIYDFMDPYKEFVTQLRRLDKYMPYVKRYAKMVYEFTKGPEDANSLFSE